MQKISVIVPIFNVCDYLKCCIESILNQSFKNFELLLIDDGSTDASGNICKSFLHDERIRYFKKTNGGLSSARNFGIDRATGDYLCFIDGDDAVSEFYLQELFINAEKNQADITVCNYLEFQETIPSHLYTHDSQIMLLDSHSYWGSDFFGVRAVVAWNKLFRKSLFDFLRFPVGKYHEDEFVIHHLVHSASKIVYVDKPLYFYRQRKGSIMATESFGKKIDAFDALFDRYCFFDLNNYPLPERNTLFWRLFNCLLDLYRFKNLSKQDVRERKKRKKTFVKVAEIFGRYNKKGFNIRVMCFNPKIYLFITRFYKF